MKPKQQQINVADVLAAVDIVDVISPHVPIKKRGKTYTGCCPFHNEKTPSFHVNRDKQFYHCFGCGVSGNSISFVMEYFRLDFKAACEQLVGKAVYVDQAEIKAAKARQTELKRLADQEEARIHAEIATKAEGLWAKNKPVDAKHPYLVRKGIKGYGLKQLRNMLVVPVRDENGKLWSLQFIRDKSQLSAEEIADGKDGKSFLTGGKTKSCYAACGKPGDTLLICEGVATRDSLHEATGYATAAAFSAGNLLLVAQAMRRKFPNAKLVICADNDQWKPDKGNPGVKFATEAAAAVGGVLAVPQFVDTSGDPTDFNDLFKLEGLDSVRAQVLEALGSPVVEPVAVANAPVQEKGVASIEQETQSRREWEKIIANSDFEQLVYSILPDIQQSTLREPTKALLTKQVAKKAGVSLSLFSGGKAYDPPTKPPDGDDNNDERIAELNEKHAVVPVGGGVWITHQVYDPMMDRFMMSFWSVQHFQLRYRKYKVIHNGDRVDLGDYWLDHPKRKDYDGVVFSPDQDVPGYLNLWRGWGCEAVDGDCSKFLRFTKEVICNNNQALFIYVMKYFAHMVQRPRELPEVSIVLRGKQGLGKNTFFETMGMIVGKGAYIMLNSLSQIAGRFSGHLCDVLFVVCNEGVWGGNKDGAGILKSMSTDEYQPMEKKGKDIVSVRNFKRVLYSTNERWAVPRGADDRRHVICDVSEKRKEDHAYFAAIRKEQANGGLEALHYRLKTMDIEGWHPRLLDDSLKEAGWEMKLLNADSVEKWWMDVLLSGWLVKSNNPYGELPNDEQALFYWPERISKEAMQHNYLHYCHEYKFQHPEHTAIVTLTLREFGVGECRPRKDNPSRKEYYKLPSIEDARANFCKKFGIPDDIWGRDDDD